MDQHSGCSFLLDLSARCSMPLRLSLALCLLSLTAVAGCSSAKAEVVPPLEQVSGTVMLDGKPTAGIAVTFVPGLATTNGNPSYGITDAEGKYTLSYRNGAPGVPAGEYVAMFTKMAQKDGSPVPEGKTAADVMAIDIIPARYRSMDNRQMTCNVPAGGKTFDFQLKSK
jgi:hypothetical protein